MKNNYAISLLLILFLCMMLLNTGCESDDSSDSHSNSPSTDDDDDDNDDDNDDNDDDTVAKGYIFEDLPINCYHMASTHNTYIWKGPVGGPLTLVSSLGILRALNLGQLFMEIDVTRFDGVDDFLVNHGSATHSVRLSSLYRNIRWWSDTHPDHEVIVLGHEWNAGSYAAEHYALIEEFFIDPSPLTATPPFYSLQDWLDELLANLDSATKAQIDALSPKELALVVGYPTVRDLRGKIILEMSGSSFSGVPSFFQLGGNDGQMVNGSEDHLTDVERQTEIRMEQRLTRIYPSGRTFNTNFDLFAGLATGVSNNAMNMATVTKSSPSVFAFMDETAPGFAPAGYVQTIEPAPSRLGPPVFATTAAANAPTSLQLELTFDPAMGLDEAPITLGRVIVSGLSEDDDIAISSTDGTVLKNIGGNPAELVFALAGQGQSATINIDVNGDSQGYSVFSTGPTLSGMILSGQDGGETASIWISPTFNPIDLTPTGNCTNLGLEGQRLFGTLQGDLCSASDNPSFWVEMAYDPS